MGLPDCVFCGRSFEPRRAGRAQKFCSRQHRRNFHAGLQSLALEKFERGEITLEEIRDANARTRSRQVNSLEQMTRTYYSNGGST